MKETSSEPGRLAPGASPPTSPNSTPSSPRRARFSLLTLVWLLTIAALSVGLWQTGLEVLPLREEVARVRKELGYFPIDDPTKIQIRRVRGKLPHAWQWRLYLPRSRRYALYWYHGAAPDGALDKKSNWFRSIAGRVKKLQEQLDSGESGFDALLTKYDGSWWLRMGPPGQVGSTMVLAPHDAWLGDGTEWVVSSDASYESAKTFDPLQPVILLDVVKRIHGLNSKSGDDPTTGVDRVMIWLAPLP